MKLHVDRDNFKDLIEIVSSELNLDKKIIEKDYWITYALSKLSEANNENVIFRGGTSLTKCYIDLKRFSEDIDLAINTSNLNNTQIKKIMRNTEKIMTDKFIEVDDGDNIKSGDYRKVQYKYESIVGNNKGIYELGELNENIKIETVTFLKPNPYEKRKVKSMIYDYLEKKNMIDVIEEFQLEPFDINVLSIKRTILDKIVSLIRMSYEDGIEELKGKTRHLYDLHLTFEFLRDFYENKAELKRIIQLVLDDEEKSKFKDKYPYKEKWNKAPIWNIINSGDLKEYYEDRFGKSFVYGKLPAYEDVVKSINKIREYIQLIE